MRRVMIKAVFFSFLFWALDVAKLVAGSVQWVVRWPIWNFSPLFDSKGYPDRNQIGAYGVRQDSS
jgi:hypothetical protein